MAESEVTARSETPVQVRRKSSLWGDVFKLVSGTTLAQAVGILIAPILPRFYAPDAFGTAAVFTSIVTIVGGMACLSYERAIMLPERDEDAANLLGVSLCFVLVITSLSIVLILFAQGPIVQLLNAPDLAPYLWLVPLAVLFRGGFLALRYWNSRRKHFGRLSIAQVSQSVTVKGSQLGMIAAGQANAGGLIGGRLLGSAIVTGVLGGQVWRDDRQLLTKKVHWKNMTAGMKRYSKFPLFDTWSGFLNQLSQMLPAFLLTVFFSSTIVGYYAVALSMVQLPLTLIGAAISQAIFPQMAEANMEGDLRYLVEDVFQKLVALALFPTLALAIVGQDVFVVVFGENWAEAGVYAQILSPWVFFAFMTYPVTISIRVFEMQQVGLYFNIAIFISRFLALLIGGYVGSAWLAVGLFSISGVLNLGWYTLYGLSLAGVSPYYGLSILLRCVIHAVPGLAVLFGLKLGGVSPVLLTVVATLLILVYETVPVFNYLRTLAWVQRFTHRGTMPIISKENGES